MFQRHDLQDFSQLAFDIPNQQIIVGARWAGCKLIVSYYEPNCEKIKLPRLWRTFEIECATRGNWKKFNFLWSEHNETKFGGRWQNLFKEKYKKNKNSHFKYHKIQTWMFGFGRLCTSLYIEKWSRPKLWWPNLLCTSHAPKIEMFGFLNL